MYNHGRDLIRSHTPASVPIRVGYATHDPVPLAEHAFGLGCFRGTLIEFARLENWRPALGALVKAMGQSLNDPHTVAAIIHALRRVHGDAFARYMVTEGMTLAALIDTLLRPPLKNGDAVKLITKALRSGDFIATPEIVAPSHLTYIYDPPKSLHVVDIAIETLDGTIVSADIRLRLRDSI